MSAIELILKQPWVARAGWTLVHFLWQGALLAFVFAAVRGLAGRRLTPRSRYAAACFILAAMTLAPVLTYLALGRTDAGALPAPVWLVGGAGWERALPWLVVVWFCGVTGFSVRLIGGWHLTARLRKVAVRSAPREWEEALGELIHRMKVSAPVRLLISSRVAAPVVVGWLRPLVLMPVTALTGLPFEQVRALLAHELAHVYRRDYLVNILQSVAEALLFYHPAVWWVSGQIRAEREFCCDEMAVAACGDALTYASALADIESARRTRLRAAVAADGGSLLQRIRRLAGESQPLAHNLPGPGTAWAVGLLWLAGIGAVAMHGATDSHARVLPTAPIFVPGVTPAPVPPHSLPLAARQAARGAVAALLFDPLFPAPSPQVQSVLSATQDKKKIHVSGTILSLSGAPVTKATVRLSLAEPPADQRPTAFSASTDAGGKFTFEDVQPGNYMLMAQKTGFLPGRYGARTASAADYAMIPVTEGAGVEGLEVRLTPQGTVSGRITNVDGDVVPHAWVYLVHTAYADGKKRPTHTSTTADSLGIYTFTNVSPGSYYLGAQPMENPPDLPKGMTDLMSYYPSAPYWDGAPKLDVTPGARIEGINVRLLRGRTYFVRGKVTFNGALVTAPMTISVLNPPPGAGSGSWGCQVRDGLFTMHDQSPGPHLVEFTAGAGSALNGLVGKMVFTITDSDMEIVFPLERGAELRGILKADGQDWQSQAGARTPGSMTPAAIAHPSILLTSTESQLARSSGRADDSGAFKLTPTTPGEYLINVSGLPRGWYVKSVSYDSQDATRAPLHIGSTDANLEIEVSSKGAAISGALRNDKGVPLSGYVVSAWPSSPSPWSASHGVFSGTSDRSGTFRFAGLPPGRYHVAAFEELESGLRQFPEFLAKFNDRAESLELNEGSQANASIRPIAKDAVAAEVAKLP